MPPACDTPGVIDMQAAVYICVLVAAAVSNAQPDYMQRCFNSG